MKATTESHYANILTTALEGGLHYVDLARSGYKWYEPGPYGGGSADPAPNGGGNVVCTLLDFNETDENDNPAEFSVTLATVSKASGILAKRAAESRYAKYLLSVIRDPDSDYDWDDAFAILQYGVFGEVVYG